MKSAKHPLFRLFLLCFAIACLCIGYADGIIAANAPAGAAKTGIAAESNPVHEDSMGRGTPYGTVIGFLKAVEKGRYQVAANYLEPGQSDKNTEQLARDLEVVLNRGLKTGLSDLSKAPEGHLDDGLSVHLERVGTATYGGESLDILLRRTTKPDTAPIWLFAADTLRRVGTAAEALALPWGEAIWSPSFREVRVFSFPAFRLVNTLVIVPLTLAATWFLSSGLVALFRRWIVRRASEDTERALFWSKGLLALLIFSLVVHLSAAQAVTVAGRVFAETFAGVLFIVALGLLLVHVTKSMAAARILQLRRTRTLGNIAVVELVGWLLMAVWVIGAFFLILHSLHIELTPAMAGLGVGGIAVAFAAQKTIENLFGTVMIVADETIHVGDYCQAGAIEGSVESIGLRSTRIRTPDRMVISVPNGQLAGMSIGNAACRDKFLFRQNIRLRYDTSATELRHILELIKTLLAEHPAVEQSTARIRLVRFAEFSLELEAFAYVLQSEADRFLEIQEGLLLRMMDIIEGSGTAVALPYQSAAGGKTLPQQGQTRFREGNCPSEQP